MLTHKIQGLQNNQSLITCSKLTIEALQQGVNQTPEQRYWRRSGVFIANFEHMSHLVLGAVFLTLSR